MGNSSAWCGAQVLKATPICLRLFPQLSRSVGNLVRDNAGNSMAANKEMSPAMQINSTTVKAS
jgi:hypothetical protein